MMKRFLIVFLFLFGLSANRSFAQTSGGGSGGGAGVTTWNGRSGTVVPATSDYSFSQVGGFIQSSQLVAGTDITYNQTNGHLDLSKPGAHLSDTTKFVLKSDSGTGVRYVTFKRLQDTAAAIRADFPSGGGGAMTHPQTVDTLNADTANFTNRFQWDRRGLHLLGDTTISLELHYTDNTTAGDNPSTGIAIHTVANTSVGTTGFSSRVDSVLETASAYYADVSSDSPSAPSVQDLYGFNSYVHGHVSEGSSMFGYMAQVVDDDTTASTNFGLQVSMGSSNVHGTQIGSELMANTSGVNVGINAQAQGGITDWAAYFGDSGNRTYPKANARYGGGNVYINDTLYQNGLSLFEDTSYHYAPIIDKNGNEVLGGGLTEGDSTVKYVTPTQLNAASGNPVFFDRYTDSSNVGTGETVLYAAALGDPGDWATSYLANNGDKIQIHFAGTNSGSATASKFINVYLNNAREAGGALIFSSGGLTIASAANWDLEVMAITNSPAGSVRAIGNLNDGGLSIAPPTYYVGDTDISAFDAGDQLFIVLTAQETGTGAGSGHITAGMGTGWKWSAANPNH